MGRAFACFFLVAWLLPCGPGQARAEDAKTAKTLDRGVEAATDALNKGKKAAANVFEQGRRLSEDVLEKGGQVVDKAREKGAAGLDLLKKNVDALTEKPQDAPEEAPSGNEPVYSRLIVHNRCYRNISVDIEEFKKYWGYSPRWIEARSTAYFELWPGAKTPLRTYSMTRDGAPGLRKTLENMLEESEKSTASLRSIFFHQYTYAFCKDEADLETPDAEFARAARPGEQIDIFEIYLTKIEGSKEREYAYKNYPITFFFNNYPILRIRSDGNGYARISLPQGVQGRLSIYGPAFDRDKGLVLYKEWAPIHSFTAKGGETVYRIPPHKNTTEW